MASRSSRSSRCFRMTTPTLELAPGPARTEGSVRAAALRLLHDPTRTIRAAPESGSLAPRQLSHIAAPQPDTPTRSGSQPARCADAESCHVRWRVIAEHQRKMVSLAVQPAEFLLGQHLIPIPRKAIAHHSPDLGGSMLAAELLLSGSQARSYAHAIIAACQLFGNALVMTRTA